ncbi:MAG: aminomethyltransferase [Lysobacteraceae bacterium]|nr:MAG: aminomethyltransferase [Xanthomonadaceae bacterium]
MTSITNLSMVSISGEDSVGFLQSQLATDLRDWDDGSSGLACMLAPNGRVIAVMRLKRLDPSHFLAAVPTDLAPLFVKRLSMYVLRSKVKIEVLPGSVELHDQDEALPTDIDCAGGGRLRAVDEVHTPPSLAQDDWLIREARAGVPFVFAATTDTFIGQALGLDRLNAISFKKGCYPGQEVVARLHFKGRSKRSLVTLARDGNAQFSPGQVLQSESGRNAAELVYEVDTGERIIGLAVVKEQYIGEPLTRDNARFIGGAA